MSIKFGKFITKTIVYPTIRVDCADGTHEYCDAPATGEMVYGKFITKTVVHPTIRGGSADEQPPVQARSAYPDQIHDLELKIAELIANAKAMGISLTFKLNDDSGLTTA